MLCVLSLHLHCHAFCNLAVKFPWKLIEMLLKIQLMII